MVKFLANLNSFILFLLALLQSTTHPLHQSTPNLNQWSLMNFLVICCIMNAPGTTCYCHLCSTNFVTHNSNNSNVVESHPITNLVVAIKVVGLMGIATKTQFSFLLALLQLIHLAKSIRKNDTLPTDVGTDLIKIFKYPLLHKPIMLLLSHPWITLHIRISELLIK